MLASARAVVATAHLGTDLATVVQPCLYAQAHLDSEAMLGRFESDLRAVVGV